MIYINKNKINEVDKKVLYELEYPVVTSTNINQNELDKFNKAIYDDVKIFKEVVSLQSEFDVKHLNKKVLTEYKTHLNKNNIISISMQFSQIVGLYSITYINCYNYDFNKNKYISLDNIFKKESLFDKKINEKITQNMDSILKWYCYDDEVKDVFRGIQKNQTFYIEEKNIMLCFSSYEFDKLISTPIEVSILFSEFEKCLSGYTKQNILNKK